MATLDEIFATMPEETGLVANDVFYINPDTRQIDVPDTEVIFGVTSDGKAERKYFQCPRYVGNGLDLAACFLRINYRNANGETDAYLIEDMTLGGDYIYFSWELWPKVTAYKGNVQFIFCAIMPGSKATYPEWNTTLATGQVLEGLEPDGEAAAAATADVIAQLLALVDAQSGNVEAVGAAQVAAVQAEGNTQVETVQAAAAQAEADALAQIEGKKQLVLDEIPAEYTAMGAQVDKLTRITAGAIVCEAQGESIQVRDSSDNFLQGLRLFGKTEQVKTTGAQLLDLRDMDTINLCGITIECKDETLHIYGTPDRDTELVYMSNNSETLFTLQPGTYTISYGALTGFLASGDNEVSRTRTFVLSEPFNVSGLTSEQFQNGVAVNKTVQVMLNAGDTALPWEPYTGGVASPSPEWHQELHSTPAPAVTVAGKNLAYFGHILPKTAHGVTFSLQEDGSIIARGTPTVSGEEVIDTIHAQAITRPTLVNGQVYESDSTIQVEHTDGTMTYNRIVTITDDIKAINSYIQPRAAYYTSGQVFHMKLWLSGYDMAEFEAGKPTQLLQVPKDLPGVPAESGGNYTDANGQQWICDEVDLARGVYVQRVRIRAFDGTESWVLNEYDGYKYFLLTLNPCGVSGGNPGDMCTHAAHSQWRAVSALKGNDFFVNPHAFFSVNQGGVEYTDAEAWKAYLAEQAAAGAPVTILYTLAEPIETPLTEAELAAFRELHSNKPTTNVWNDAGAWMAAEYVADTKLYIDRKLEALVAASNA